MRLGVTAAAVFVVLGAGASAASPPTVPLAITITGTGSVKVTDKAAVTCTKVCHATLQLKEGSRVVVLPKPGKLWKAAPWTGVCASAQTTKCNLSVTGPQKLAVAFIPPGVRSNPIPLNTPWPVPGDWVFKVLSVTPDATTQVKDLYGKPIAAPPPGAQDFMFEIAATYRGGGSSNLQRLELDTEGSRNAPYGLTDLSAGCGPGDAVSLPAPDLQYKIENPEPVYSGQTVTGNICFQIAANDAASLLFYVQGFSQSANAEQQVWFALATAK